MMTKLEQLLTRYFHFLEQKGQTFNMLFGLFWVFAVGAFDFYSPTEVIASFLYLLPITFVTWFAGKRAGMLVAIISAAIWSWDNITLALFIEAWNILSIFGVFCIVSVLVGKIRQLLDVERTRSRKDPLTGVMNMRAFAEVVEYEILRLQRQCCAFSLAYLDLDNFKTVNDRYGHTKGDELLKAVVDCLVSNLRKTDVVARAGGDEFIVFFPITDEVAVQVVTQKVREKLLELSDVNNWPTTISMGVLTCTQGVCMLDDIIKAADKLMYEVKNAGKNNIRYAEYSGKRFPVQEQMASS
jgi:diguanylate cyclase (GGDEF)-like protein